MQANSKQLFFFLCLSLLGFLFFTAALFFLPLPESKNQVWKGYHTILLEEDADLLMFESAFLKAGFEEVIHFSNAETEYFDFYGLRSIRLEEVPLRFEELDPRVDSYMRDLTRYFHTAEDGTGYSIIYVKEKEGKINSIIHSVRVLQSLSGTWRFVDIKPLLTMVLLGIYGVISLFVVLSDRPKWIYLLAASLPWAAVIFLGGFFEFIAASILIVTFSVFFRCYRPVFRFFLNHGYIDGGSGKARFSLVLLGMALTATIILLLTSKSDIWIVIRFVYALFGMVFLFFYYNIAAVYSRHHQEHRLFFRVPLAVSADLAWVYHLCIFSILIFSPAAVKMQGIDQSPPVPSPVVLGDLQKISAYSIEKMNDIKSSSMQAGSSEEFLPDIADYFTHKAYQEGFLLGREYMFPRVGEIAGVSSFSGNGDQGIRKSFQEMVVFSADWFDGILENEDPGGLLGLWLNNEYPVGTRLMKQEISAVSGPFLFRHVVLCMIIFIPIVFLNNRLTPQLMYGIKSLMLRRKRQEA